MKKKYILLAVICVIVGIGFGLYAALGSALFGKAEPEAAPLVSASASESEEPEPEEPVSSEISSEEPDESAEEEPEEPYVSPIDFAALQEENSDIYAWLDIPGTDISYPLLQSATDDTFYLNHDRDGNKKYAGSLFTEHVYNSTDMTDRVTVVYGHNMKSGSMFGYLQEDYSDPDSFEENKEIIVYLPDRELHFTVFAAVPFDSRHLIETYGFQTDYSEEMFLYDLSSVRSIGATYDTDVGATSSDQLLVLSTCLKGNHDNRFLVVAKLDADQTN